MAAMAAMAPLVWALLLLSACLHLGDARGVGVRRWSLTPRQEAALTAAGFLRDSVERVPSHEIPIEEERGSHRSSLRAQTFGSKALPLRSAVEKVPTARDRSKEHIPLRDAVERRPAPESEDSSTVLLNPSFPALSPNVEWLHTLPNPFLAVAGVPWPANILYRFQHPVASPQQPFLPLAIRSSDSSPTPALQPEQRWGITGNPNFVFHHSHHEKPEPVPVLTYQANNNAESGKKIVCYFEAWAAYRKDIVSFSANNMDPFACTHLIYAFAAIDPHTYRMQPQDEEYDLIKGGYRTAVGLKRKNPALKVMLSVGGWMEGSTKFSQLASQANRRREFIRSVVHLLETHKFDGLDLDWEYPGASDLGGLPGDKGHFSLLVEELSEVFRPRGWLLSAAVSPSRFRIEDAYDIPRISQQLDLINLMAFDLHAERDSAADHHAPLTSRPHDTSIDIFYNVDYAVKYWIKRGAPPEKLILGIPFYGRSFTLKDTALTAPSAPIKGLGKEGRFTQEKGFLAYFEICELQSEGGWKLSVDRAGSPFMVKEDQWIGYEDVNSISRKIEYIRKQKLGGVMIWAVDLDDFQGICGEKNPLLSAARSIVGEGKPLYVPLDGLGSSQFTAPFVTTGKPVLVEIEPKPPGPTSPHPQPQSPPQNPKPPQEPAPPAAEPGLAVSVDNSSNCNGTGYVGDTIDCNVYYRCDWNKKTSYVCPEPLHFNPALNLCDWPQNAGCREDSKTVHYDGNEEVAKVCALRDGVAADPEDCARYYWCHGGRAYRLRCARGQYFHAVSGLCIYGAPRDICQGSGNELVARVYQSDRRTDTEGEENFKVACYFTSWASYRKGDGKFVPEYMDPRLCTHIVYAFASLDPETLTIQPFDNWADIENNFYDRLTSLPDSKQGRSKDVKVLLSMGGWTDSTGDKYSKLVSNEASRRKFVTSAVAFLRRHNFGGLQLDWNYPKCWQSDCKKGPDSDKPNFTKFVEELHEAFNKETPRLVLAVGISGYKQIIDSGYELDKLAKYVEYMSVMSFDYHGNWEGKLGHVSPLYFRKGDANPYYNTNSTMEYLVSKGAPKEKLLMGLPFYGQSFTMKSTDMTTIGSPSIGPGSPGEFTMQPGMLAYYEICERIRKKKWTLKRDNQGATGPYAYYGEEWASFDDVTSIKQKAQYVKNMGFGGAVAWTVDLDDFGNRCCMEAFPLLSAINRVLGRLSDEEPLTEDCTKPPTPATPTPPVLTTGVDTGAEGENNQPITPSTTWPTWTEPVMTVTTSWPSWNPTTPVPPATSSEKPVTEMTQAPTTPPPTIVSPTPKPPENPPHMAGEPCQSGEYEPDPENCNAFYRCILGELKKQYCAGGLHWNKETKVCDWPTETNCATQGGASTATNPSSSTSTSSTTESSTSKRPDEWWTPASTTARPDQWWTHSTTSSSTTVTTSISITTQQPTITTPDNQESKPTDSDQSTETPCVNGQYYPSVKNCSTFSICVNGRLIEQHCAPGLVWNPDTNMCDWRFNVKCADNELLIRGNDAECKMGEFRSHPQDCTQYYMCVHGELVSFSCAPGLQWNKDKQICDWPTNSECTNGPNEVIDTSGEDKPSTMRPTPPAWKPPPPASTTPRPEPTTESPEDKEPLNELSGYFKIVCYFTNWAWYRQGLGKYVPEDINGDLCTHIVYGFAVLDYENLVIKAHDSWADFDNKFYERVVAYKKKGKKVSLAIGGWNDSAGDKYSRLVNSPSARRRFIKHVIEFLDRYNFDGLDLDWEYPKCWQVNCDKGPESDKAAFGEFVRELRAAFDPKGLLLSSAVSPSKTVIDAGYDVPAMALLDWVAVMTYDYHGSWDKKTGHVAPMYFHPDDDFYFFNANYSINYWIQEGVPRRKVVMGMPLYGQAFTLAQASTNGLNARAPQAGQAGEFTRAAGFLAYYEICDRVKNRGWTVVQDPKRRMGPYAFHGTQWVGYDDVEMIKLKSQYIRDNNLGGGMIWALDLDDFRGRCGQGKHPLLKTIRRTLGPAPNDGDNKPVTGISGPNPVEIDSGSSSSAGQEHGSSKPVDLTDMGTVDNTPIKPPTSATMDSQYKVVCYFTNWAWYRQGLGKYLPSNIDPDLCTHVVYGFAVLDGDQLIIKPHDTWADIDNKFYEKVTALKSKGVKVTVAIGGWNDSAGDKYSRLANNPAARTKFVNNLVEWIEKYNFDGLDLDWEYPKCWQVNCKQGPDSDKQGFAALVRELREAFNPKGWLLSSAVSPNKAVIDAGYDVPAVSRDLDWIAVMAYDYHGQWDKKTGHVAPMFVHPEDVDATFNTNFTINYWIAKGADPKKLVLGMPMYGQSFSLADNNNHGLNAPTYGGGEAGDFTRARGFLSYYEICYEIEKHGWTVVRDPTGAMGPYAYHRDQWVGFDDIPMIRFKSEWIKKMGLGGGMIWALDLDDFTDRCHCETYPLLKTINRALRNYPSPDPKCVLEKDSDRNEEETNLGTDSSDHHESPDTAVIDSAGVNSGQTCNGQIFVPHESDCNKYYQCQFGELLLQACPENLYWSKDHCDWPENSKCSASSSPDKIPTTTETSMTVPTTMSPMEILEPVMTTPKPVTSTDSNKPIGRDGYKVVCYFTNWAWYRQGLGKYTPEDIDSDLCTHITYGFAVLDGNSLTIKPHDSWADIDNDFYRKVVAYQKKGIKVLIAIGGWNDSLGDKYSRLVNNPSARTKFVKTVAEFIEKYGFDGLDLDWEYPKCWQVNCNSGPDSDKEGFASLVRELSAEFKPRGWLLSSAVSPSKLVIDQGYDVPTLSEHFDWIAVMAYDYNGHWNKQTGHVAPLYYVPGDPFDYFNTNFTMHYWLEMGADPKKLVMGMPMYGQSFTLADPDQHGLNAKSYGPGEAGQFTRAGGFLAFYEICENVKKQHWTVVRDEEGRIGPYAYRGNQWVGYDDVDDIRRKTKFIKKLGLGGGMIWALDLDDFTNRCGCGVNPLLKTINQELRGLPFSTSNCT